MRDEDEVMRITNQYRNEFRENCVGRFKDEFNHFSESGEDLRRRLGYFDAIDRKARSYLW